MPNADFLDLASKLERAVRWLLISNGAGTSADVFTSGHVGERPLPNRTVIVETMTPIRSNRREGILHLQIQHRFDASVQDGVDPVSLRVKRDKTVAETDAAMTNQSDGASFERVADQITFAGRDLAVPNAALTDPADIAADLAIVAANLDMINFRCDEVTLGNPYLERGHEEGKKDLVWMVNLNFLCRVSNSAAASN